MLFTNLFVGYNEEEDFRILICAFDKVEAAELARGYRLDSNMKGDFEISELEKPIDEYHFDCDYVIA